MTKVNQQQIAEALNLSRTTVSRCFTNHPKINPETRVKVFELAAQLGYQYSAPRNVRERQPRGGNTLAVLIGLTESGKRVPGPVETEREILGGISEGAAAARLDMEIHHVDPSTFDPPPRARRVLKHASPSRWKGLVLLYPFKENVVSNLMARVPTVSVLEDYNDNDVDCINPDQVRGISRMVEHLVSLGHRRLGFLTWKYSVPTPWVERRLGAFVENLFRFNLEINRNWILNIGPEESLEMDALSRRAAELTRTQGVTAWVCAADHQAYSLIADFKDLKIRVPGDCSVTGFDGIIPPHGLPQITTVRVPFQEIGFSAVTTLIRKSKNPMAARRHILVSGEPIIGQSTAAPPAPRRTKKA